MAQQNDNIYYSLQKILSHNKIMNFIIGNRGGGKSFEAKRWAISGFLKNKKQFVYVRRYKTELVDIKNFFSDIEFMFPNVEFLVEGGRFYINGQVAGYYMPLSTAQQHKSNSYPEVDKIIFDEFILDKGKNTYLKGEVQVFLDLFETIARMRDDVRAVLIANAISVINPYFTYFKIYPRANDKFIVKGETVTEIYKSEAFIEKKKQTRFGKLIDGSQYGDYAIENMFLRDNKSFIEKMHGKSTVYIGMKYMGEDYAIYVNEPTDCLFFIKGKVPDSFTTFVMTTEDHMPNLLVLNKGSIVFQRLKQAYEFGKIRFDNINSKAAFYEIMQII